MEGLYSGLQFDSLSKNVLETLLTLQAKVDKYIATEKLAETKRKRRGKEDQKRKEPDSWRMDNRGDMKQKRPKWEARRQINDRCRWTPPRRTEVLLPPLNVPIAQVLMDIKNEKFVKWPRKIKTNPL